MNALTRKVGPLPVWAWGLIVVVIGYFVLRRMHPGTSAATQTTESATPQTTVASPDSSLGLTPSAGSPSDTGQTTSDLVTALGGQQASLLAALEASQQDIVGLAQSQISALQQQTTAGPFQTQTDPGVAQQPGGSNAPTIVFLSPTMTGTPTAPAAAAVAARSSSAGSGGAQPYGGVVSTQKLKNGSILTTYASGRQVQQVPGKSPYVVRA